MKGVAELAELAERVQRVTLRIPEAAQYLGIGVSTMYCLAQSGAVRSKRVGKRYLFRREDLDAFLAEESTRTKAEPASAPEVKTTNRVTLKEKPIPPGSALRPLSWR